jgi:rhodanese-related sulfurtransferase
MARVRIRELSPSEARSVLADDDREIDVVDLRDAGAFAAGHIVAARLVPAAVLSGDPGVIGREREVLLYDGGEGIASRAASFLARLGYADCFVLQGGFPAWLAEDLPVEP